MRKFTTVGVMLALLLAVPLSADVLEAVLVKVNGDIITKTDLEQRQIAALRQKMNGQLDQNALKNDAELKKMLADVTPEVLVNAVDELLLVQYGRDQGWHLGDDQFREIVNNIRKEQNLQDEEKFQAALRQEGMTMDDLRRQLERQMLIQRVQQQEVGSKLSITEAEARQYYDAHPKEFTDPSSITLREVLVEVPADKVQGQDSVSVAKDDAAAKKVEEARRRLLAGEDFAKVATELSDAASKANGGLIGPFSRQDMSPQLQQLVDKMKPGDISPAIHTQRGYQIFKLETLKPEALQPFDKVRDLISDRVAQERTQSETRKFLVRLRNQALIEWKNPELKKAYDQQLATTGDAAPGGTF